MLLPSTAKPIDDDTRGDGLGNFVANTLPTCQLRHLQSLVNRLQGIVSGENGAPWWCDILCVPAGNEDKRHRKAAIGKMQHIYRSATKVLALDSGLAYIAEDAPALELYVHLRAIWLDTATVDPSRGHSRQRCSHSMRHRHKNPL